MIIKEIKNQNERLVWYKNKITNTLYIVKITENKEYKVIRKKRLKDKKKNRNKWKLIFPSVLLTFLLKDPLLLCSEDKEIIKLFVNWDQIEEEKYQKMMNQISEICEKNENFNEEQKEILKEEYPEFISNYGEYLSRWDYLDVLLSTRFVKVEEIDKSIINNNVITYAYYIPIERKIYTQKDLSYFFHEKIHATDKWLFIENFSIDSIMSNPLYEELFASYASKKGYEDLRGAMSLIGELLGKESLEKNMIKRTPNEMWKEWKKSSPEQEKEIMRLENLIKKIYILEYKKGENAKEEKEKFWNIFKKIYQEKTNKTLENDIVIDYFKDQFMINTTLENKNKINYGTEFYLGNIKISLENRNRNYKDILLNHMKEEKNIYGETILEKVCEFSNNQKCPTTYKEYDQALQKYLNEQERNALFNEIIQCENLKEYLKISEWLESKVELSEKANKEITRKRTKDYRN